MEYMPSRIALLTMIILVTASSLYADMKYITIEDASDHEKITKTINKIIDKINKDKNDDARDKKEMRSMNKYQIYVDNKIVKKMIQNNWISQHSEVEPN